MLFFTHEQHAITPDLQPEGTAALVARAVKLVKDDERQREREIKAWTGVGAIPKRLTRAEKEELIQAHLEPEAVAFVKEQRILALLEATAAVNARHKRELEEVKTPHSLSHSLSHSLWAGLRMRDVANE